MALVIIVLCFLQRVSQLLYRFERAGNVLTEFYCKLFQLSRVISGVPCLEKEALVSEHKHLNVFIVVEDVFQLYLEDEICDCHPINVINFLLVFFSGAIRRANEFWCFSSSCLGLSFLTFNKVEVGTDFFWILAEDVYQINSLRASGIRHCTSHSREVILSCLIYS
jgi:hypothetical protein